MADNHHGKQMLGWLDEALFGGGGGGGGGLASFMSCLSFKPFHIAISEGSDVIVRISSNATDIKIGKIYCKSVLKILSPKHSISG